MVIDCGTPDCQTLMIACPEFAASGPGQIQRKFLALKASGIDPGLPTTPFLAAPDGRGFFQHYSTGMSIYWSPNTWAHAIHGAIRDHWESLGWEAGVLGYPLTDVTTTADGKIHFAIFQYGTILCDPRCKVLKRYLLTVTSRS